MAAVPGSRVGRFILVAPLGQGGMGSVWVATDPQLDRKVAIKLILHAKSPAAVARFVREARNSAKLNNPHVVVVYECGEEVIDGTPTPYIAMELLDGEDLKTRLQRTRTLSIDETTRVITHVAKALSAAHKAGIVHRDIKTDNIMLVPEEGGGFLAKVLDFGIAKSVVENQGITATGDTLGTPQYMSPEQVRGDGGLTPATDLWSLGVVAYRSLTGAFPFSAPTLYGLLPAIVHSPFLPVSASLARCPEALDAWFSRALAKAPEDRFATAMEMAEAFAAAAATSPVSLTSSIALSAPRANNPLPAPTETQSVMGTAVTAYRPTGTLAPKRSPVLPLALALGALAVLGVLFLVALKLVGARSATMPRPAATVDVKPAPAARQAPTAPEPAATAPVATAPEPAATAPAPAQTAPPRPLVSAALPSSVPVAPVASQAPSSPVTPAAPRPSPKPKERRPLGF